MKASDFLRPPQIKLSKEEGEEHQSMQTQSQVEWFDLSQTFFNPVSHVEANIASEAELELARKELEEKGIIKQEKIERKYYTAHYAQTLKPYILSSLAKRLESVAAHMETLEEEELQKRDTIAYFQQKEFVKRKHNMLCVHILDKIFLPLETLEQGLSEAYLQCIFFFNGSEHRGYVTEKSVASFSYSSENKHLLEDAILAFRDRAKGTQIMQEYFTKKERASIQRVHTKPSIQSPYVVFLLCSLKTDCTFAEILSLLSAHIPIHK
ncbi:hypothetical protein NECID01_0397 [Nematocida sp. AWRm77]|nr:hypothetical protein NECID01_0397 [Nematocida sp. AWRm77]